MCCADAFQLKILIFPVIIRWAMDTKPARLRWVADIKTCSVLLPSIKRGVMPSKFLYPQITVLGGVIPSKFLYPQPILIEGSWSELVYAKFWVD